VKQYTLESYDAADADVEVAFNWYQTELPGLGLEFLDELRVAYRSIASSPLQYKDLGFGIRRALVRRFPYAIYFAIEEKTSRCDSGPSYRPRSGRMAMASLIEATLPLRNYSDS
jgi:hypothetical protein